MSKKAEELARRITGLSPEGYNEGSPIRIDTQRRLALCIALIDAALCEEREQFGHAVAKALRENHAFDSDEAIAVLNEAENILLEWRTP
jgi:hypothetical protein